MNAGRTVFAQIMDFLPRHEFRKCIARYGGQRKVQRFSCMDQFLCMAFAQLSYRESLRDIEACLRAVPNSRPLAGHAVQGKNDAIYRKPFLGNDL